MWFKPHLDWLLRELRTRGGTGAEVVGAIMDDAAAIAAPAVIAAVQPELVARMRAEGSTLQVPKCVWHAEAATTRASFPTEAKVGTAASGTGAYGVDIDGIPVGNSAYKQARHEDILEEASEAIKGIEQALVRAGGEARLHRQAAFALLRVCVHPKISHLLRCAYPSDVAAMAPRFDQMPLDALQRAGGLRPGILHDDGGTGLAIARVSLPVAKGGWGIRKWTDLAPIAFLAGAAAALPAFVDRRVLKARAPVVLMPARRAPAGQPRPLPTVAGGSDSTGRGRARRSRAGGSSSSDGGDSDAGRGRAKGKAPMRDYRSRLTHRTLPPPRRKPRAGLGQHKVVEGMFPSVGAELMGAGAFDSGGQRYKLLLAGDTKLAAELEKAWTTAREALQSCSDPGTDSTGAATDDMVEASRRAATRGESRALIWTALANKADGEAQPAPGKRLLLDSYASAADSALGYDVLPPGGRLQRELTAEIEGALHRSLWRQAMAVLPPATDGKRTSAAWHDPANSEALKAFSAAAAWQSSCAIARSSISAWPGMDTHLGNGPFRTMLVHVLGLGDPDIEAGVGRPIGAPGRYGKGWRTISTGMDCRGTDLYCASFPGQATFSRRHDGLVDRLAKEGAKVGLLTRKEYTAGVMSGLDVEHQRRLHDLAAAALHYSEPPLGGAAAADAAGREAARAVAVVDGMKAIRPDLLVTGRGPNALRMLFEVKSMAFGFTRYKTKWHNNGATWVENRAEKAVAERDQAAAAIDSAVFPAVHPPPMQGQVQRLGGVTAAVIGGFCEHSPAVHEYIAMCAARAAPDTAAQHGWTEKEATAYERYRIRQRLATGAWREFHENKTARLPFVNPSAEYARTLTTLRHSEDRARAQRNLAQAYSSGTAGVGGTHTHNTHGGVDPPS